MLKTIIKTISFLFIVISFGLIGLYFGWWRFNYPSKSLFPVRGIDVSHHQGNIDWSRVAGESVDFVFIKATEGGDFIDPNFNQNFNGALKENIAVGCYHFYRLCTDGNLQAKNFLNTIPDNATLPAVVDLEYGGNCELTKSKQEFKTELLAFLDTLEKAEKRRPILYTTYSFYYDFLQTDFRHYPIWIRDLYSSPEMPEGRSFLFWQYANRGKINGIETYVDLNVFNGDRTAFKNLQKRN